MIYLDNAATTRHKPPQVEREVLRALHELGNAGRGAHGVTLDAARIIYDTRVRLAELFHAEAPEQIAFASNATEALNTAIGGLVHPGDHVITTVCEHNSVLRPLYRKESEGASLTIIGADANGEPAYEQLASAYRPETKLLVVTHVSNLTGNRTDLFRMKEFAQSHGLLFVVDAAQSAGHFDFDVNALGIDALCFTGHKGLFGLQGTGGIYVRKGLRIPPLKVGGSGVMSYQKTHPDIMPTALEAGTLPGHGIAGLSGGLQFLKEMGMEAVHEREQELVRILDEGFRNIPGVRVYGNPDLTKRSGIVSINVENADSGLISDLLWEEYEIAVRAGAHCAPLMHQALGTEEQGAVRFSVSVLNTREEMDAVLQAVSALAKDFAQEAETV